MINDGMKKGEKMEIVVKDEINPYKLHRFHKYCKQDISDGGVYFLWDKSGKMQYIGKSIDIYRRISEHGKTKQFTFISYIR